MGYSLKDYGNAFLVMLGFKAEQIMTDKADQSRELIRQGITSGRDIHVVVERIVIHAKANYDYWQRGAVAQVMRIYQMDEKSALAIVSEMS